MKPVAWFWLVLASLAATAGCGSTSRRPPLELMSDMRHQPKYKPQAESAFFEDGRASRQPPPGTVAHGAQLRTPAPAWTPALLARGQERFNIYCAPCHGQTGSGQGIVALRGSWLATNLAERRIREFTDEQIFETITFGVRTMPAYRFQVPEPDRWAIVAYVRALQRAAATTLADVPPELRNTLR